MSDPMPRAARFAQLTAIAFLGAGGVLLLLAQAHPGTKSAGLPAVSFALAVAMLLLTRLDFSRSKRRHSPIELFFSIVLSATWIAMGVAAASANVREIALESAQLDRARLLTLAQSISGISQGFAAISLALLALRPQSWRNQPRVTNLRP